MSAINLILQHNSSHLITDGAAYRHDGTMLCAATKAWPLPHLCAAVATRGPMMFGPVLIGLLCLAASTFDQLQASIADVSREAFVSFRGLLSGDVPDDFDIVVAGISETNGPTGFIVGNHTRYGFDPWTVTRLEGLCMTPSSGELVTHVQREFADRSVDDLDPAAAGLHILELQHAAQLQPDSQFPHVGAFAQITSVTADRIETRILRRWADKPGCQLGAAA